MRRAAGALVIGTARASTDRAPNATARRQSSRHFLVQGASTLELQGLTLVNGTGNVAGGTILARHEARVVLVDTVIKSSLAVGVTGVSSGFGEGAAHHAQKAGHRAPLRARQRPMHFTCAQRAPERLVGRSVAGSAVATLRKRVAHGVLRT